MPSSNRTSEILIRREPLTEQEWIELIEGRRMVIKPHLNSFTLGILADLECLRRETFEHAIRIDSPQVSGDERFSLKTQGIFYAQPWQAVKHNPNTGFQSSSGLRFPDGEMKIWGLTRNGLWVLATVYFCGEPGYKDRGYERALLVKIVETDVPTILAETGEKPRRIWELLGEAIKRFAKRRRELYQEATVLVASVEREEYILPNIPN